MPRVFLLLLFWTRSLTPFQILAERIKNNYAYAAGKSADFPTSAHMTKWVAPHSLKIFKYTQEYTGEYVYGEMTPKRKCE